MGPLKKMLNQRPSILLLVVVKPASAKRRIIVPVPVAVVTVLVETAGFWGSILTRLGSRLPGSIAKASVKAYEPLSRVPIDLKGYLASVLSMAPRALEELWLDLISHGSWSLVDIESSKGDRVLVRFI